MTTSSETRNESVTDSGVSKQTLKIGFGVLIVVAFAAPFTPLTQGNLVPVFYVVVALCSFLMLSQWMRLEMSGEEEWGER